MASWVRRSRLRSVAMVPVTVRRAHVRSRTRMEAIAVSIHGMMSFRVLMFTEVERRECAPWPNVTEKR